MSGLQRLLTAASSGDGFIDRAGAHMDFDRREILKAIVETRGDVREIAQRLAPDVLERLRARAPERAAKALDLLAVPLSPPPTIEQIAEQALERYGARLEEMTGGVTKAAATAKAAAAAMGTLGSGRDLLDAMSGLEEQVAELNDAARACAHPEGALPEWADHGRSLAREGADALEAARELRSVAQDLRARCESVAQTLNSWAEAPPAHRASTAEEMAVRLRAAAAVVADMKEQIARLPVYG